jgi:predicted NUDIX family NTP pyrophosphohydrolase
VVKNEGEPGGPFWVQDDKGDISLQIVESSQVNIDVAELLLWLLLSL